MMSVKERPILFSGGMVKALLAGNKTQTRRIVKPLDLFAGKEEIVKRWPRQSGCPYGKAGEQLWVREAFQVWHGRPKDYSLWYAADGAVATYWPNYDKGKVDKIDAFVIKHANGPKLLPSLFMPRWASRITVEIADVRVEKLCDISEADAIAEGVPWCWSHRRAYADLWEQINGEGAWDENPYVWVVEFKVLQPQTTKPPAVK